MLDDQTYRLLKTTFWIIVVIYLAIIGSLLLLRSRKLPEDQKAHKRMHIAWAMFMFFYIATRLFFLLSDFEGDINGETLLRERYVALAYICFILAFWNIIFQVEKHALNLSKHIVSYIIIFTLFINIILFLILLPNLISTIGTYLNYALLYSEFVILLIIYIYLFFKTTGILKKKAIIIILGICVVTFGETLDSSFLTRDLAVLSPVIFAIGMTIFFYGQLIKLK